MGDWPPLWVGITLSAAGLVGTALQFFWKRRSFDEQQGTKIK